MGWGMLSSSAAAPSIGLHNAHPIGTVVPVPSTGRHRQRRRAPTTHPLPGPCRCPVSSLASAATPSPSSSFPPSAQAGLHPKQITSNISTCVSLPHLLHLSTQLQPHLNSIHVAAIITRAAKLLTLESSPAVLTATELPPHQAQLVQGNVLAARTASGLAGGSVRGGSWDSYGIRGSTQGNVSAAGNASGSVSDGPWGGYGSGGFPQSSEAAARQLLKLLLSLILGGPPGLNRRGGSSSSSRCPLLAGMGARELANIVWALGSMRLDPTSTLPRRNLPNSTLPPSNSHNATPTSFYETTAAASSPPPSAPRSRGLVVSLASMAVSELLAEDGQKLGRCTAQEAANLVWGMARLWPATGSNARAGQLLLTPPLRSSWWSRQDPSSAPSVVLAKRRQRVGMVRAAAVCLGAAAALLPKARSEEVSAIAWAAAELGEGVAAAVLAPLVPPAGAPDAAGLGSAAGKQAPGAGAGAQAGVPTAATAAAVAGLAPASAAVPGGKAGLEGRVAGQGLSSAIAPSTPSPGLVPGANPQGSNLPQTTASSSAASPSRLAPGQVPGGGASLSSTLSSSSSSPGTAVTAHRSDVSVGGASAPVDQQSQPWGQGESVIVVPKRTLCWRSFGTMLCGSLGDRGRVAALTPRCVATVAHGLARLRYRDEAMLVVLVERLQEMGAQVSGHMAQRDVAMAAAALAQLQAPGIQQIMTNLGRHLFSTQPPHSQSQRDPEPLTAAQPPLSHPPPAHPASQPHPATQLKQRPRPALHPHPQARTPPGSSRRGPPRRGTRGSEPPAATSHQALFMLAWAHAVCQVHAPWMVQEVLGALGVRPPGQRVAPMRDVRASAGLTQLERAQAFHYLLVARDAGRLPDWVWQGRQQGVQQQEAEGGKQQQGHKGVQQPGEQPRSLSPQPHGRQNAQGDGAVWGSDDLGVGRPESTGEQFGEVWNRCRAAWLECRNHRGARQALWAFGVEVSPWQQEAGPAAQDAREDDVQDEVQEQVQSNDNQAATAGGGIAPARLHGAGSAFQQDVTRVCLLLVQRVRQGGDLRGVGPEEQQAGTQSSMAACGPAPMAGLAPGLQGAGAGLAPLPPPPSRLVAAAGQDRLVWRHSLAAAVVSPECRTEDGLFAVDLGVVLPAGCGLGVWGVTRGKATAGAPPVGMSVTGDFTAGTADSPSVGAVNRETADGEAEEPCSAARVNGQAAPSARHQVLLAVEVDGPSHFTSEPPYLPLGAALLRNHCLAARGWHVVSVPWWEWDALAGDEPAKEAYLEGLLQHAWEQAQHSVAAVHDADGDDVQEIRPPTQWGCGRSKSVAHRFRDSHR